MTHKWFWLVGSILFMTTLSIVVTYANAPQSRFLKSTTITSPSLNEDVKYADIDSDGDIDIISTENGVEIWINDGEFNFSLSQEFREINTSFDVEIADLNGDNMLDIYAAGNSGSETPNAPDRVLINSGSGMFTLTEQRLGDSASWTPILADIDNDGDLDAIISACYWPISSAFASVDKIWLNDGNGSFTDSGIALGDWCTVELAIGDFNGDKSIDILRYNVADSINHAEILFNSNEEELAFTSKQLFELNDPRFSVSDLNQDGYDDLLLLSDDNDEALSQPNNVWLNDRQGNLLSTNQALGLTSSAYLTAIDYDQDGDIDVITTDNNRITHHVWLNMDNGIFINVEQFASDSPTDLTFQRLASTVADTNNDTWPDIAINTNLGVEVWVNQQQLPIKLFTTHLPVVSR